MFNFRERTFNTSKFQLEPDYVKLKPIKPALAGYIRESQILLKRSSFPDEKAVHDIRVLMKKSRALLKLFASQKDIIYYDRDMHDLREVGRKLRLWRETAVQRKLLRELRKKFPLLFRELNANTGLNNILEKPSGDAEPGEELKEALVQTEMLLKNAGYRLRFRNMNIADPHFLIKELELTYLEVAGIYLLCRNNPRQETLHKFRKRAKDFLYQLYVFRPLNPPVIKALEKKLDTLTQNLGKYNDLAQIVKSLGYNYKAESNSPALDELIIKIRDAQDSHLRSVWTPAYKIFCPGKKLVNVLGFKLLVI